MLRKKEIIKIEEVAAIEQNVERLFNESAMHKTIIGNAVEDLIKLNEEIDAELEKNYALSKRLAAAEQELNKIQKHNYKVLSGIQNGLAVKDNPVEEVKE